MFDTMTLTKIVGALCGAFLVFLLGKWAAETIYFGTEGGGEEEAAYSIEIADAGGSEEAVEEGPAFADLFAAADVAKGEKLYGQCKACHKLDGTEGTGGPHLNGIVGRAVGSVAGYTYTAGVAEHGGNWDPETLNAWLTSPKTYIAGTKMTYAGMKKPEDRANLIAWLATVQ